MWIPTSEVVLTRTYVSAGENYERQGRQERLSKGTNTFRLLMGLN